MILILILVICLLLFLIFVLLKVIYILYKALYIIRDNHTYHTVVQDVNVMIIVEVIDKYGKILKSIISSKHLWCIIAIYYLVFACYDLHDNFLYRIDLHDKMDIEL